MPPTAECSPGPTATGGGTHDREHSPPNSCEFAWGKGSPSTLVSESLVSGYTLWRYPALWEDEKEEGGITVK